MIPRQFKHESWLYALAFILALGLRLVHLGALPLTDAEAGPALQALHIAQGLKPALSPHPFYILLTAPLFFLYGGATNFLARVLPALAGAALVFAPRLFQKQIKPCPALILAFFLVFDPGLVALSRTAASGIFAIALLLFAWGFWASGYQRLAGAFAALTLLSGPNIWAGLLAFGIVWAIRQGMESRGVRETQTSMGAEQPSSDAGLPATNNQPASPTALKGFSLTRPAIISFVATLLSVGTLLFVAPNGLSAALASLPEYLRGWNIVSLVPSSRLLFSLAIYQPLGVALALVSIVRGWWQGSRRIIQLSLWLLVSLLLAIFYSSHQVSDVAWALVPLWALAALELARHFDILQNERKEVAGVAALALFILFFAWLDFTSLVWQPIPSHEANIRFGLLVGSLTLLVVSIFLVAFGWSFRSARFGAVWGISVALGAIGFAGMLGVTGLRGPAYPELWSPSSSPAQADLLTATINDLSDWSRGDKRSVPVVIVGINSPALEWALREHPVRVVATLDSTTSPEFVITFPQADPSLASAYRGQDFIWRQTPAWDLLQSQALIRWIALREVPQNGEAIILWAREDLFLDKSPLQSAP